MDTTTLNHIIELKQRLITDKHPNLLKRKFVEYLEDVEINTPINNAYTDAISNRGNKLFADESLQLTNLRSFPSSLKYESLDNENRRLIVNNDIGALKRQKHYNLYDSNGNSIEVEETEETGTNGYINDDEDEYDEDEDPLASINLAEILAPIQHPSDVVLRKSFAQIFNPEKEGNHLLKLAYDTIEMIESEQDNVIQLTKLMNLFLGDEYQDLTPDNINLPDYDHKLSLKDLNLSTINNAKEVIQEESENEDDTKDEDDDRKIHTRSKDNTKITDPFFQLPDFKPNKAVESIDPQELEETRQLTQITLQRNQEYIRCLAKIRNGCVKVDKFKQNIYKWAKEMNGDYSEVEVSEQSKESSVEKDSAE